MSSSAIEEKEARSAGLSSPTADRLVAELNNHWRVVDAPPHWYPQWILQRKEARARARSDGWVGNAYCTTRTALARNIVERCGDVDPAAMAVIEALPERHPRVPGRQRRDSS